MHITIQACFLCFFYNPYMSLFNSKNFSFTCLHYFFTCLKQIACLLLLRQPRTNVRGGLYKLCIQYTNGMCAPFCTSPNCSTDSSPQNVLTCNIALGQEASTVLIDLGLAELRSVRDSVAPRSYIDSRSHSDSRARLGKARSYIG